MAIQHSEISAIAIGRNEGQRLIDCLDALQGRVGTIIYVDSGSNDGSREAARARDAAVIELDLSKPFTAARARNAGVAAIMSEKSDYVQFLDGDCMLQGGWLAAAKGFLDAHPNVAVVCGRRREKNPEASVYNRMIDREWDTPIGQTKSCGGDALMRLSAFKEVGGFREGLIAGEEPELCVRLRAAGWQIWRLDAEMTLHDANITRFGQWWTRAKRAGHAFAQGFSLHGQKPERHNWRNLNRILAWGIILPLVTLLGATMVPWFLLLLLVYPAQFVRTLLRGSPPIEAFLSVIARFPEALGVLSFYKGKMVGQQNKLIEYK